MKKIILMAFAASIITLGTQAQVNRKFDSSQNMQKRMKRGNTEGMKRGNTEGMNLQALDLTADQKSQMHKNQEEFKLQREAVRNDASLTPEQKKTKMQEIQKASWEKASSLLTAEQKAKLKANRKDEVGKDNPMAKGKGMQDMKGMKDMNFTADQKAKMQTMRTDMKTEMDKIKNNASLSQDQKKEQMKAVQKKHKDQMGQILTPEQKLKMKDQQGKMKNHHMKKNQ